MYLCHKCSGVLSSSEADRKDPGYKLLHGCGCISGWVRDWQEPISVPNAVACQYAQAEANAKWWNEHDKPEDWKREQEQANKLLDYLTAPATA